MRGAMSPVNVHRSFLAALLLCAAPALAQPGDGVCDAAAFAGGEGSAERPYLVQAPAALDEVRDCLDRHFRQVAPIDLSSAGNWKPIGALQEGQRAWDPRAPRFTGVYDGAGHPITGLRISRPASDQALFGRAGPATFVNVHVEGEVTGLQRVGLLVGGVTAAGGQQLVIRDSSARGRVTSAGFAGGLVGDLRPANLVASVDHAEVRVAGVAQITGTPREAPSPPDSASPRATHVTGGAVGKPVMVQPGHADALGQPGHFSGCGCH